jgi:mono/diheme cytochrome c family protein
MFGKSIENRILVGVTSFVGIMVLVGWIAINEGGRMLAFERQFNARSIERGAALFATNCSPCHGTDGRGILGRGPGLNNPQLFGHDFLEEIDTQIEALTAELASLETELAEQSPSEERIAEINARLGTGSIAYERFAAIRAAEEAAAQAAAEATAEATEVATGEAEATPSLETQVETAADIITGETPLEAEVEAAAEAVGLVASPDQALQGEQTALEEELAALQAELATEGLAEERANEINARIAEINARLGTESIPAQILDLQEQRTALLNSLAPAQEKGYDPNVPSRLEQLGWAGSLDAFIYTTLVHGRPVSGLYWPSGQPMPAWSQAAGGPLRNDQLQDLTAYILNFDKGDNWTLEDLFAVQQFAIVPGAGGDVVQEPVASDPAAVDLAALTAELMTLTGDPQNGQTLYNSGRLACAGCHTGPSAGVIAPALEGTWTRVVEERLTEPRFAGYSGEQYLVESILLPNAYIVPSYTDAMPDDFGQRLDIQMLADLVAFLKSQDGPSPE